MFAVLQTVVVADAVGWDHMSGWGWGGMAAGWLLMIGLVSFAVWAVVGRGDRAQAPQSALEVLETRFARGEISTEEYRQRRDVLIQSQSRKRK